MTNERDFAADLVIRELTSRGVDIERWNAEETPALAWSPLALPPTARMSAVWLRQFLPEPQLGGSVEEIDDFLVVREQWRATLTDLAEAGGPRWMNPLWAARRAENKLVQLRTAVNAGMSVPATRVTNDPSIAVALRDEVGPCIVKAVAAAHFQFSTSAFMFTQTLDEALALDASEWDTQPVVVQQQVTPRADVRLFVVGDFAAAAGTTVDAVDWRVVSAEAEWTRIKIPSYVVNQCRQFMKALELAYGAFDFAFDGDTFWFLECNQAGEFAFIDRPLELGVTQAIANWLSGSRP
ncbi:hypothetical protein [Nocardioides aurantiacus]|uniref:hypothetical protein n=1 Tax=Nocardioides aurantiacus TaxID=86796 RepID=UPI00403FB702